MSRYELENRILVSSIAFILMTLLAGNIYFVKGLVEKVNSTETIMWELKQQIVVLNLKLEELQNRERDHGRYR